VRDSSRQCANNAVTQTSSDYAHWTQERSLWPCCRRAIAGTVKRLAWNEPPSGDQHRLYGWLVGAGDGEAGCVRARLTGLSPDGPSSDRVTGRVCELPGSAAQAIRALPRDGLAESTPGTCSTHEGEITWAPETLGG
jgi:hypothetical protein